MLYSELKCSPEILQAVERMGFTEMTEVQEKAIPVMMAGKDVIAKAPTGTGKTCAFGIPIIERINPESNKPQAVILAPTRELAQQIAEELTELAHFLPKVRIVCVYGGANIQRQAEKLKKGCQIVVATPGRLMDHMHHKNIDVSGVTSIVLDEADEMLNMGFYKDVRRIIDSMKARKSLCMFSATISREVMDIGWLYQRDAEEISVQPVLESQPKIHQYKLLTNGRNKLADLAQIIISGEYKRVMVFCNTKFTTAILTNQLARLNFVVDCLEALRDTVSAIGQWLNDTFNPGRRYSNANPSLQADTARLRSYAQRVAAVNRRLRQLDRDMNDLYWQVGFLDLWDILMANLITGGSPNLKLVESYLNYAADRLEEAERKVSQNLGG